MRRAAVYVNSRVRLARSSSSPISKSSSPSRAARPPLCPMLPSACSKSPAERSIGQKFRRVLNQKAYPIVAMHASELARRATTMGCRLPDALSQYYFFDPRRSTVDAARRRDAVSTLDRRFAEYPMRDRQYRTYYCVAAFFVVPSDGETPPRAGPLSVGGRAE